MEKTTRKQKKALKKFNAACVKWRRLLWLGDFNLDVSLADLNPESDKNSAYRTHADSEIQTPYRLITIRGDTDQISNMSDSCVDDVARHELIHAVVAPLNELLNQIIEELPANKRGPYYDWKRREIEAVTTHLTDVTYVLHRAPKGK